MIIVCGTQPPAYNLVVLMFKRRKPLTALQHVRELFWPSMGWRRMFRYIRLRIQRLSDSTHSIALGLAIGVAMAFNPFIGTHFFQVALLAWILRANILCGLVGNCVGNPWTFPFIWWAGIQFGAYLFRMLGLSASTHLPAHIDFGVITDMIVHNPFQLLLPWTIGGYVLGLLTVPVTYLVAYRVVKAGKLARSRAKLYKIHRVALEVTGENRG